MLYLLLAVLICAVAGGGWYIQAQQQLLTAAQADLVSADERLVRLEKRLSLTDRALDQSGTELRDQIALWEREARRAWQIAWVQNRPRIDALEAGVKQLDVNQKTDDETLRKLRSTVSAHAESLGTQAEIIKRLAALAKDVDQLARSQRKATDGVGDITIKVSGLDAAVASNTEAIRAIDLFRQQTNRTLQELRGPKTVAPPVNQQ